MKCFPSLALGFLLFAGITSPVTAERVPGLAVVFHLRVYGHVGPDATFWVAYGPLADRFGLIRLHDRGHGRYTARAWLPSSRTVFAYLMGYGTAHTAHGDVPGNPVITIRRVGPVVAQQDALPIVHWNAPLG